MVFPPLVWVHSTPTSTLIAIIQSWTRGEKTHTHIRKIWNTKIHLFFYPKQNEYTLYLSFAYTFSIELAVWLGEKKIHTLFPFESFRPCKRLCVQSRIWQQKSQHAERLTHNIIILREYDVLHIFGIKLCTLGFDSRSMCTILYLIYSDKVHAIGHDDREKEG